MSSLFAIKTLYQFGWQKLNATIIVIGYVDMEGKQIGHLVHFMKLEN